MHTKQRYPASKINERLFVQLVGDKIPTLECKTIMNYDQQRNEFLQLVGTKHPDALQHKIYILG